MGFVESFKSFWKGFIKFDGTTEKMEFIWHIVTDILMSPITCGISNIGFWATCCRRMETMGYNKWLGLIQIVFPIWFIVMLFLKEK